MTLLEKVIIVLNNSVRNEINESVIPLGFIEGTFDDVDDSEMEIIREKSQKLLTLCNEAEKNGDTDFLKRDLETDIWLTI